MSEANLGEGEIGAVEPETPEGGEPVAARFTKDQVAQWEARYATGRREIYRWLEKGRAAGDPPPLDDPLAMPSWWARHSRHRVPAKLLAASMAARGVATVAEHPPASAAAPVVVADDGSETEEVAFTRQLVSGYMAKLSLALAAEDKDSITYYAGKHKDAVETLKKQKAEARSAAQSTGLFVSRAEVDCDIFAAVKMLSQMHAHRAKRVLESLREAIPDLSEALAAAVTTALEAAGERELDLFRNLQSLKSSDDVSFRLAA